MKPAKVVREVKGERNADTTQQSENTRRLSLLHYCGKQTPLLNVRTNLSL